MTVYQKVIKPILFTQDPERMHHLFNDLGWLIGSNLISKKILELIIANYNDDVLRTSIAGLDVKNPIGLGAGFDKEGKIVPTLEAVGFGFAEIGTITGQMSPGNNGVRLLRLVEDEALVVNYGLVSSGADRVKKRFKRYVKHNKWKIPVGISVAKSNIPNLSGELGLDDLLSAYQKLEEFADYITINVSCPNVGDAGQYCENIQLYNELLMRIDAKNPKKPIFIKLSPDLSENRLSSILEMTDKYSWAKGFVLTNLTHDRSGLKSLKLKKTVKGGVSGIGLKSKSNDVLKFMATRGRDRYEFIGLGGVNSVDDVYKKIRLGASVVQLVTSLIYHGPFWIKYLNLQLAQRLKDDGFTNIKEAVGVDL